MLSSPGASQLAIADLNGDGHPDIVSADYGVSLFLQDPATPGGAFFAPLGLYAGGANWVAVGDLNGDGLPDITVTDNLGVKVLMHAAGATSTAFQPPVSVYQQTPANAGFLGADAVAIADRNADTLGDLGDHRPGSRRRRRTVRCGADAGRGQPRPLPGRGELSHRDAQPGRVRPGR